MVELSFFTVAARKAVIYVKRAVKLLLALVGVKKYREKLRARISEEVRLRTEEVRLHTEKREEAYKGFYDECIGRKVYSDYGSCLKYGKSCCEDYDYVIAGSDQIWNRELIQTNEALRFYYLSFAERSQRVNYAPSFGDKEISPEEYSVHRKGLEGFDALSCREKSGCKFIRSLTGRESELVLDPTLLHDSSEWRSIARMPKYFDVPEHYVLAYFIDMREGWSEAVNDIAGGLKVIDILSPSFPAIGPREFVWLIDNADYVLTGSFHGTAFSVIFRKNFLSFLTTDNRSGRIGTLLSSLELMDRIYSPGIKSMPDSVNYSGAYSRLNAMREASMKYLRGCLKVHGR